MELNRNQFRQFPIEFNGVGFVFKSEALFNRGGVVCYIPEGENLNFVEGEEELIGYTREDFEEIALNYLGDKSKAKDIFDISMWEYPETSAVQIQLFHEED